MIRTERGGGPEVGRGGWERARGMGDDAAPGRGLRARGGGCKLRRSERLWILGGKNSSGSPLGLRAARRGGKPNKFLYIPPAGLKPATYGS